MELTVFFDLCGAVPSRDLDKCMPYSGRDYDKAYQLIRNKLTGDSVSLIRELDLLEKRLAIWSIERGSNYDFFLGVLNCLFGAVRSYEPDSECQQNESNWQEAIELVIQYRHTFHSFSRQSPVSFSDKVYEFALAYTSLSKYGVHFTEKDHELFISEESYNLIDEKIYEHCRAIGGKNLLDSVFVLLSPEYKSRAGRFVNLRKVSVDGRKINAEVPYGYLLAIGARHVGDKGKKDHSSEFASLLLLCRDLVTIFEIQVYSQWQTLYLPAHGLIRFLQESVWYDNIISFSQIKSQYSKKISSRLSESFVKNNLTSNGFKLRDIQRVANAVVDLAQEKFVTSIRVSDIAKRARMQEYLVSSIMKGVLSFQPGLINATLKFPPVSNDIDYYFKPAITKKDGYYLYPKSICALGALNSILNTITSPNNSRSSNSDRLLGYEVEDFLREEFQEKGIKIAYGTKKDKKGNDEFECDLLVETDRTLFIFEIKKKGLTRKAMSGDEISLLSDLADSLLFSHMQAMNIEYNLKKNAFLELVHEDLVMTVALGGRRVKRVSVSLNDFGALQDKISLQKILLHAADTKLVHPDQESDDRLKKWRKYSSEINRLAMLNNEYEEPGHPFHNSFFMSIPQIMTILNHSTDANDFEVDMSLLSTMILGTRNFYSEYFKGVEIRGGVKEMNKAEDEHFLKNIQ